MPSIKNINGTSSNKCNCASWLEPWKKYSRQPATYCSEKSCTNTDLVGAHVQKAYSTDSNWYIIPLCQTHNQVSRQLETTDNCVFVSANVSETCGKTNRSI